MKKEEKRHQTLYRTYRPSDFDAVRGQQHVTDVLRRAIENKKFAHAYLFCGGRGTGKTSVARILAKEIGVTDRDLYEIDAASNRGIDDIRELREGVLALPFESPYKLYIIDEAHMLTKDAWNAFLKTLEEPPAHCLFVMATTERDKVPDTIQSRCEVYSFKQPTRAMLADIVGDIAKKEAYTLERSAAELIALIAEGSFRDALSLLQKVLAASSGTHINLSDVEMVSGAPRGESIRVILSAIAKKDVSGALAAIDAVVASHTDARVLTKLLIHRLRAVLLMRFAPDLIERYVRELSESDIAMVRELSKEPGIHSETLRALLDAYATMAYAAIPQLPLELAVIDVCGSTTVS